MAGTAGARSVDPENWRVSGAIKRKSFICWYREPWQPGWSNLANIWCLDWDSLEWL
jgi:hypothetical protein